MVIPMRYYTHLTDIGSFKYEAFAYVRPVKLDPLSSDVYAALRSSVTQMKEMASIKSNTTVR